MSIKVRILPGTIKRPENTSDLNWRESYARAHSAWLAQYTGWVDPDRLDENRYYQCPHGCLVATDTEDGREANYCTICHPLSVATPPRLKPYGMATGHPLRRGLHMFPREGVFYLTRRGTIGRHYYPGDHEVCPYEPRWRMRTAEAPGGYRRSGKKDGNAVLAFPRTRLRQTEDESEDELEGELGGIRFATILDPWEFDRPDAYLFRRHWFNSFVVPMVADDTSPLEFAELGRGRLAGWSDFTERPRPEAELTPSGRVRHKDPPPQLSTDSHKLRQYFACLKAQGTKNLEDYRIRRPRVLYVFTIPPLEGDVERWRKKYWTKRNPGPPLRNPRSSLKTALSEPDKKALASSYRIHGGFSGGWSKGWVQKERCAT